MEGQGDRLRFVAEGDVVSAEQQSLVVEMFRRHNSGENVYADGTGVYSCPIPQTIQQFWGKLKANVTAGNQVDVDLWQKTDGGWEGWDEDSDTDKEDVYCPPTIAGLPSGCMVLIGQVRGRWVIAWPHILRIKALAKGAVTSANGTFTADNVTSIAGPVMVAGAATEITVTNYFADDIDDNGKITATWDGANQIWSTDDALCPA